jgi:hypothetical protein
LADRAVSTMSLGSCAENGRMCLPVPSPGEVGIHLDLVRSQANLARNGPDEGVVSIRFLHPLGTPSRSPRESGVLTRVAR